MSSQPEPRGNPYQPPTAEAEPARSMPKETSRFLNLDLEPKKNAFQAVAILFGLAEGVVAGTMLHHERPIAGALLGGLAGMLVFLVASGIMLMSRRPPEDYEV